jgi:hypothetical protein
VRGQLLLIVDDVNCGLLGGGCASVDTDVISHQVCLASSGQEKSMIQTPFAAGR